MGYQLCFFFKFVKHILGCTRHQYCCSHLIKHCLLNWSDVYDKNMFNLRFWFFQIKVLHCVCVCVSLCLFLHMKYAAPQYLYFRLKWSLNFICVFKAIYRIKYLLTIYAIRRNTFPLFNLYNSSYHRGQIIQKVQRQRQTMRSLLSLYKLS